MSEMLLEPAKLTDAEFRWIQKFLVERTGIELKEGKQTLVMGRLERRVRHHGLSTYTEYFRYMQQDADEERMCVDLLTTNETYFFRESQHFDRLPDLISDVEPGRPVRIWSAASSTGEEAYTIALTLAECLGRHRPWEVVGTDISGRVLETARRGLYPIDAAAKIPRHLLQAYCLKGRDDLDGFMTTQAWIRKRVSFSHANLTEPLPDLGQFDVVFLRNVLIYFGQETKRQLIERIMQVTRPGGHLLIGHAESVTGLVNDLIPIAPSVYRVPGGQRSPFIPDRQTSS